MKDAIRGLHNNTFWEKVKAFPVGWQAWGGGGYSLPDLEENNNQNSRGMGG